MLPLEHSAILLTFIKLPFVIKVFVLSIFECLFYTGLTVLIRIMHICSRLNTLSAHSFGDWHNKHFLYVYDTGIRLSYGQNMKQGEKFYTLFSPAENWLS